jgi:hypothetical protein
MRFIPKGWLGAISALAMLSPLGVAHAQNGLLGEYFVVAHLGLSQPNRGLLFGCTSPAFTRVDPNIDLAWGSDNPKDANGGDPPDVNGAAFPADGFAVRWTGTLKSDISGSTIFVARPDDGMRVWLKEKSKGAINSSDAPIIDTWGDQGPADHDSAPVSLTSGT